MEELGLFGKRCLATREKGVPVFKVSVVAICLATREKGVPGFKVSVVAINLNSFKFGLY